MLGRVHYPHEARVWVLLEKDVYLIPHLQIIHLVIFVLSCPFSFGLVQKIATDVILAQRNLKEKQQYVNFHVFNIL